MLRLVRHKRTAATPLEYPRLALYRSILRAHQRYLPPDARAVFISARDMEILKKKRLLQSAMTLRPMP